MDEITRDEHLELMERALEELREGLAGGDYLVADQLTYADIAMATSLQFVAPVDERYIRLGRASRKAWSEPALSARYADLVAWRDRLYERHRETKASERA
jgi:glutathione S-transferase